LIRLSVENRQFRQLSVPGENAIFRQSIFGSPFMRAVATLPCGRCTRQPSAFWTTIEEDQVSALVENTGRRSFYEAFESSFSETQHIRIIGHMVGQEAVPTCGFFVFSLRLDIAFERCGLHGRIQMVCCSLFKRGHEVAEPPEDVLSDIAIVFHRSERITT
jgi:hypothetical protein